MPGAARERKREGAYRDRSHKRRKYHEKAGPLHCVGVSGFVLAILLGSKSLFAHCDWLDGPVVTAAEKAIETGKRNPLLIWVQKKDEAEIKKTFQTTLVVKKLNPEAQELADMYFFETLVRIHRAGEEAPYTDLKPAGRDLGPAIPAGGQGYGGRRAGAASQSSDARHSRRPPPAI
jgi:hypothetical protein